MKFWDWPNLHDEDPAQEVAPTPESLNGRVKVQRKDALRGWVIIPAVDVKPTDVVLARYPD